MFAYLPLGLLSLQGSVIKAAGVNRLAARCHSFTEWNEMHGTKQKKFEELYISLHVKK